MSLAGAAGTIVVLGDPGSGAGRTTLQGAYDNDPTDAQIILDTVPNPLAVRAAVAGQIFVIQDVGGATDIFEFTDVQMTVRAPILFDVDLPAYQPANPTAFLWNTNVTYTAAYIGGFIGSQGNVNVQTNTFIWGLLTESRVYIQDTAPAFAAYTLLNGLPVFQNGTGSNQLLAALYMNVGSAHRRLVAGTSTTGGVNAINMAPALQTTGAAGATMTQTSEGIASMLPQYNTVFGTTVNFGDIFGLRFNQPAIQLFGTGAGTETVTSYVCIDAFPAGFTFGGAGVVPVTVIESNLPAGTNYRLIDNVGGAESDFGGGDIHLDDGTLVKLGATVTTYDVGMQWNNASGSLLFNFTANGTQLRISEPAANRLLFTQETDLQEFNFSCGKFSFGDSTGAVGNQVGNFVTPARTITVAGEWADFLLTQAGNLTVNGNAMSRISAWVVNGVSYASSSGTVTNADTLTVGGFPTSSPGVTITNRHSLNVIGGRSRHASAMQFPPISPAALASGDNDDWNGLLTGSVSNSMRHWARLTATDDTSAITGIDSSEAQSGDTFKLTNVDTDLITIRHEDTGSLAANRIITPNGGNYSLSENKTIEIAYDTASSRWRILTPAPQASATLSGVWQFDSTTTMADPGDGEFRNNNATIGSVTAIAIADETKPGTDAGNILAALASGDQLYIQNQEDASEFLVFDITSNTDNTGWHQIGGTVNASGSNFTDGKEFIITAIFA